MQWLTEGAVSFVKSVIVIVAILFCTNSFGAKIYKCKDASGKVVFSNKQCKGSDAKAGLLGEDSQLSQRTKITQDYKAPVSFESNAEKALRQLREEQDRERRIAREEKLDRKAEELERKQANAKAKREQDELNDCLAHKKEYEANSKYWKAMSKQRRLPKKDKYSYESNQHFYTRKASEC